MSCASEKSTLVVTAHCKQMKRNQKVSVLIGLLEIYIPHKFDLAVKSEGCWNSTIWIFLRVPGQQYWTCKRKKREAIQHISEKWL